MKTYQENEDGNAILIIYNGKDDGVGNKKNYNVKKQKAFCKSVGMKSRGRKKLNKRESL